MPTWPIDPRPIVFPGGSFSPYGKLMVYEQTPSSRTAQRNSREQIKDKIWSARIILGFKVGKKIAWSMNDIVHFVKQERIAQEALPNATFLAQRGLYQHKKGGKVIDEPGAQVFILNLGGQKPKDFREDILKLAEKMANHFEQESIILEFQKNGINRFTYDIGRD